MKKTKKTKAKTTDVDVHIFIPVALRDAIKTLGDTEKRSFPKQLLYLLETHPLVSASSAKA